MRRYLVVANQTLVGEHLLAKVRECLQQGACSFHVVVPATPTKEQLTWTEGEATAIADERLEEALASFSELGAEATGEVGDAAPAQAILDALQSRQVDEIILSTLPSGASRWLRQDLPHRVSRMFDGPVTHIVGEPAPLRGTG